MATQTVPAQETQQTQERPVWRASKRIGFRFVFIYFGLYCAFTQILPSLIPLPNVDIPDLGRLWPMRAVVLWTARHVFRLTSPPNYIDTGSGDRIFDWILVVCLLVIAGLATAVWTALDRECKRYVGIAKWFRIAIRLCLAGQMIVYGMIKAIPLQMPFPELFRLVERYGDLSPMGVLWASIGASPGYESFAGCAELLGGVLLIFPRTTTLGALVCVADVSQVFVLNMTYDVPVKLLSFHLICLALILLAPDFLRLVNFFFLNRVVEPAQNADVFPGRRANRIALAAQVVIGLCLIAGNAYGDVKMWNTYGGGGPKSELYGIWDLEELTVDGQLHPPLLTDKERWRRAIFDYPQQMAFQRMDDSLAWFGSKIQGHDQSVVFTKSDDKNWVAKFTFRRIAQDHLSLTGQMDGHAMQMELRLLDRDKFLLVNRGFHWIQETPFNR